MTLDEWGALQDGIIFQIDGSIPGDVRILVDLDYLRTMFPNQGNGFIVQLTNCTSIEYRRYGKTTINDTTIIESKELEILCLSLVNPIELSCQDYSGELGELILDYESASLLLDTGEIVADNELHQAYAKYWDQENLDE